MGSDCNKVTAFVFTPGINTHAALLFSSYLHLPCCYMRRHAWTPEFREFLSRFGGQFAEQTQEQQSILHALLMYLCPAVQWRHCRHRSKRVFVTVYRESGFNLEITLDELISNSFDCPAGVMVIVQLFALFVCFFISCIMCRVFLFLGDDNF